MTPPSVGKPSSCFLHVHKSGGTALTLHLQNILGRERVFHAGDSRHQHTPLAVLLARFPVVTGHFHFAQIPPEAFARTFFFTVLREPVDRIISLYHFLRQGDVDHAESGGQLGEEWTLERLLAEGGDPSRRSFWSNWQTFQFSGATRTDQSAEELLPAALANLERLDFVGLYEHFDESVRRLGARRGWPLTVPVPRFKASRGRPAAVDAATAARILALNDCDRQLYECARELWEDARARGTVTTPPPAAPLPAPAPARAEQGTREITFSRVEVRDGRTGRDAVVQQGHPVEIRLGLYSHIDAGNAVVGVRVSDQVGLEVYSVNTRQLGRALAMPAGGTLELTFAFDLALAPGGYALTVAIQDDEYHLLKTYHWIDHVTVFWCVRDEPAAFAGLVDLRARLTVAEGVS